MSRSLCTRRWGRRRGILNATSESISSARLGILSTRLGAPEARKSGLSGGLGIMSIFRFMSICSFNTSAGSPQRVGVGHPRRMVRADTQRADVPRWASSRHTA